MATLTALTRAVSPSMASCELTHQPRVPIDVAQAAAQHAAYERALARLGCEVHQLPSGPEMPDAVFIEDTAVVLDDIVVVTRPGAASRRGETAAVEEWLKPRCLTGRIEAPGTLDGGDVLVAGRTIFAGRSTRTNAEGVEQLRRIAEYFGYAVHAVEVRGGCLHLKSAVTALTDTALLINDHWAPAAAFTGFELVPVAAEEPAAANIVRVGSHLLHSAAYPRTSRRLAEAGYVVATVDLSEIAKAEGAATCCSVLIPAKLF